MPGKTLNLGILAHVDAGKTSLTERLLFENHAIDQLGSVDAGNTQTDTSHIERERGITIRTAVAAFLAADQQVNLVDTPGHPDFIAEVERALSILDAVILVVSAREGVQAQTKILMKSVRKMRLPTLIFINKVDRAGARTTALVADIQARLTPHALMVNSVTGAGTPEARVDAGLWDGQAARATAANTLADTNDRLLAQLVNGWQPSADELWDLLRRQTADATAHPVFFGSALLGVGVPELTSGINALLRPRHPIAGSRAQGTVFAIERGTGGEKIAYLRLCSGQVRARQRLTLSRRGQADEVIQLRGRVTGLEVITARSGDSAPAPPRAATLRAGDIGKIRGLPWVRVGDWLGHEGALAPRVQFAPPSLETVVHPAEPGQKTRLHMALTSLADEDPLIQIRTTTEGASSVLLYGAVQEEVLAARLSFDFGVNAVFDQIRPVYLERPAGRGEATVELGRSDFLAGIGLRVEPAPAGSGSSFTRDVEWGAMPAAFHRAIEEAVWQTLSQGLHGWDVVDCAVTIIESEYHSPGSVAADFRNLAPVVLMRALLDAGTKVYEPCHTVEIEIPSDTIGRVTTRLMALGAEITGSSGTGEMWLITGRLPVCQSQSLTVEMPRLTRGEAAVWSQPGGDRLVRGAIPVRGRSGADPLNYQEYLRFVTSPDRGVVAHPASR